MRLIKRILGWFGIRWQDGSIDCDHCGEQIALYSDGTSDICMNGDDTICSKCYTICRQDYE